MGVDSLQEIARETAVGDGLDLPEIRKILVIDELSKALEYRRQRGAKVVLCHGAFDLLHIGHLRHLTAARRFGDILVVTITNDPFISKGPDRPVFTAQLRAEMLAALELVDHVAIVDAPTALPAIEAVQPDYYVKGSEYENSARDVTGMIEVERERVEAFGGSLAFTDEATHSSTQLLNRYFSAVNSEAREYLEAQRSRGLDRLVANYLNRIAKMRIVVVGETIIDRYVYVDALGKSAKENIIATLRRNEEVFAGGAVAATNHLSALCPNVELVTLIGRNAEGDDNADFVRDSLNESVDVSFVRRPNGPTVRKTRFVEPTYMRKLFEVYDMNDEPLSAKIQSAFDIELERRIQKSDLVIVCDFGHGLIAPSTIEILEKTSAVVAVNAQSNAGNIGFNIVSRYRNAELICVDALEARLATGEKHAPLSEIIRQMQAATPGCPNFIITSGKQGCFTAANGDIAHIPAVSDSVVDTVGAGDAFFVVASVFIAAGADCEIAGLMGNVAGAIKVGIVGHRRSVTRLGIQRYLTTLLK